MARRRATLIGAVWESAIRSEYHGVSRQLAVGSWQLEVFDATQANTVALSPSSISAVPTAQLPTARCPLPACRASYHSNWSATLPVAPFTRSSSASVRAVRR